MRGQFGIEVKVWEDQASDDLKIVFIKKNPDGTKEIAEPMELKWQKITSQPGTMIARAPTLQLDEETGENLLDAISQYCSGSKYRSPNENHLEGKLEATQKHLGDMRTLVMDHMMTGKIIVKEN